MRCPAGGDCFSVDCQLRGCQGYDVHIEAITVVHTTIRRRAVVGLVFGAGHPEGAPGPQAGGEGQSLAVLPDPVEG